MNLVTVKEFIEDKRGKEKVSVEDKALLNCIEFCESICCLEPEFYTILMDDHVRVYNTNLEGSFLVSSTSEYIYSLMEHIEAWKDSEDITSVNLSEAYIGILKALKDTNYNLSV